MKYKCVIFDWDGTLVDSLGKIIVSMRTAARRVGIPDRNDRQIKDIIGLELGDAIMSLYPEISYQEVMAMRDCYSNAYLEQEHIPTRFFEGIPELLADLRQSPRSLAVATGKSRRGLDRVMHALDAQAIFHGTRCADETKGKPEPDMVLELLQLLRVRPSEAVVVGDSCFDLEMASRAGVDAIGVGWGAQPLEQLASFSPASTVDDIVGLRHALGV